MKRAVFLVLLSVMWTGAAKAEVLVVKSTAKVLKNNGSAGGVSVAYLEAARNEYEGFQVVVTAPGGPLSDVSMTISDLAGQGDAEGSSIPAANVEMFLEHYVHVEQPSACFEFLCPDCYKYPEYLRLPGDYPEQLIPFFDPYSDEAEPVPVAVPFEVLEDDLQTVWVDLFVPGDTPAGDYAGELQVLSGDEVLAGVPVSLHVWDYSIPTQRNIATAYGFSTGRVQHYHGGPEGPDAEELGRLLKNYEFETHRHRMDYTTHDGPVSFEFDEAGELKPVDFTAYDAYIGPRIDGSYYPDGAGLNRFNLGKFRPGHGNMGLTDVQFSIAAKAMAEHLADSEWLKHVYLYSYDEPWLFDHLQDGAVEKIQKTVNLLNVHTDLWKGAVLVTGPWMENLDTFVDIWCPVTPMYGDCLWPAGSWPGPEKYQELMAAGRELWFYACNANFPPTMGYDTDSPIGWEPRLLKWGAWTEGATGFLYWRINYWQDPDPWNVLANFAHFGDMYARHGDGILLYPGDHDGTKGGSGSPEVVSIDGPVVSYRMKQVRDGMEDWEMLIMADALGAGDWARQQVATVYRKFGEPLGDAFDILDPPWTLDENALFEARRMISLKIQHLLQPDRYEDPEAPSMPDPEAESGPTAPEVVPDVAPAQDVVEAIVDGSPWDPGERDGGGNCSSGGRGNPNRIPAVLLFSALLLVFAGRFINA